MAVANHRHEDVGLRENVPNGGRRIGAGRRGIVAAKSFNLGADDALRGSNVVCGMGRGGEAEQKYCSKKRARIKGSPANCSPYTAASLAEE